jgi:hypothetical protein
MANGRKMFIDITNMILGLALPEDYHTNVSYQDNVMFNA